MLDGYEFREKIVQQLATHTEILRGLVEDMKAAREEQLNPLWNEFQQQKGERRLIRVWLATLSIIVAVIGVVHH